MAPMQMGASRVALHARLVLLQRVNLTEVHGVVARAQIIALLAVLLRWGLLSLSVTLVACAIIYVGRLAIFLSKNALLIQGHHGLLFMSSKVLTIHMRVLTKLLRRGEKFRLVQTCSGKVKLVGKQLARSRLK